MPVSMLVKSSPILFALALALPLRAAPGSQSLVTDSEIFRQYQERRAIAIDKTLLPLDPHDLSKGGVMNVAASFYRRANVDWANARLARIDAAVPTGDMFWMYPMATVMETGRDVMTEANRSRILQLWRTYFPYRGDTENHWLLYYSSLYLAAEAFPAERGLAWFNGKSSAENRAEARSYIEEWMRITTNYGQGEFNSPNYIEEYVAPLALLAGWAKDNRLRQEARMTLDYVLFDYAVEQLGGEYGGAHSRIYPWQAVQPGHTPAAAIGWLVFGLGDYQPSGTTTILAMSGYMPPPILYRIAHDRSQPYTDVSLKRTRWRMRHAGPESFPVAGRMTTRVYKYTYMDPDFVIGSCQGGLLQPIQQETWSLIWRVDHDAYDRQNTFFGLQPHSSPREGTMYFAGAYDTVTNLITRSKVDYDSPDKWSGGSPYEQVAQAGPALIALYDIPARARFPHVTTFFSRDLQLRDIDESGWIFCQGGPAYVAYLPFAPGEWKPLGWTGLLGSGAGGWFSIGFSSYSKGDRCIVSGSLKNGYVVQVAPARDFRSFDEFKAAVRALPVKYSLRPEPAAEFTTLQGARMTVRYGSVPVVNGTDVDYPGWPFFESPFADVRRGTGTLDIHYGAEHYILDFRKLTITDTFAP
jgi:hypothetical protein